MDIVPKLVASSSTPKFIAAQAATWPSMLTSLEILCHCKLTLVTDRSRYRHCRDIHPCTASTAGDLLLMYTVCVRWQNTQRILLLTYTACVRWRKRQSMLSGCRSRPVCKSASRQAVLSLYRMLKKVASSLHRLNMHSKNKDAADGWFAVIWPPPLRSAYAWHCWWLYEPSTAITMSHSSVQFCTFLPFDCCNCFDMLCSFMVPGKLPIVPN